MIKSFEMTAYRRLWEGAGLYTVPTPPY